MYTYLTITYSAQIPEVIPYAFGSLTKCRQYKFKSQGVGIAFLQWHRAVATVNYTTDFSKGIRDVGTEAMGTRN